MDSLLFSTDEAERVISGEYFAYHPDAFNIEIDVQMDAEKQ